MLSNSKKKALRAKFNKIYKNSSREFVEEIIDLINNFNKKNKKSSINISQNTALVISYGDSIIDARKKSLKVFRSFFNKHLSNYFNSVHFLPFYPSSSDSGFAVKDHYKIEPRLGSWSDIRNFSKRTTIMADLVINHASSRGLWFANFLKNKSPGKNYFFTVNNKFNVSKVVRPREHRLLKKIKLFNKNQYLWRTFSPDQIDLNFKNPKVLMRFLKIIINSLNHGVRVFRLDAIAYLWKENGTKCINHNNTHNIIKFIRYFSEQLNIESLIITETNLPEKENLSYFGNQDEANWIYNFSLPPLIVYSLLFEDSSQITQWSKRLKKTNIKNNYLNFIASHDGIGMRPIEGLINNKQLKKLFSRLKKNGSEFSFRKVQGKNKKVYEANITLFNAFEKSDFDKKGKYFLERFITAHAIMLAFEGIPAVYFNSMFGTANDNSKYIISGNKRDLNRYRWNKVRLEKSLKNKNSKQTIYYKNMIHLLNIRKKQKAFHPDASQITLKLGSKIFAIKRLSIDKKQSIICLTNVTSRKQFINLNINKNKFKNLLKDKLIFVNKKLELKPFQTVWISN